MSSAPTARAARCAVRSASSCPATSIPRPRFSRPRSIPFHEKLEGLSNVSYCWKPDGTFSLLRLPGVWRVSLYARDGPDHRAGAGGRGAAGLAARHRARCRTHRGAGDAALPHPPAARVDLSQGPRVARGRRRASQQPVRRHGHERRHPRRVQPVREADRGAAGRRRRHACSTATSGSAGRSPRRRSSSRRTATARGCRSAIRRGGGRCWRICSGRPTIPAKLKAYLLKSSMIDGLRRAAATA